MNPRLLLWLALLCAAAWITCLLGGASLLDPGVLWGQGSADQRLIAWDLRWPRVACAACCGAALAVAGTVLQALLRNHLASTDTLGISGGAALGAVLALRLGLEAAVTPMAFAGGLISLLAVYVFTRRRRSFSPERLLLAGVGLNLACSAAVMLVQYTARLGDSFMMMRWLMGALDGSGWLWVMPVALSCLPGLALAFGLRMELNLLSCGEDLAAGRGVATERVRMLAFAACALITAGVVSACGPIGFVGLVVPHLARACTGTDLRRQMTVSLILGAALLPLADLLARSLMAPAELPVGLVLALAGAPMVLWILARER